VPTTAFSSTAPVKDAPTVVACDGHEYAKKVISSSLFDYFCILFTFNSVELKCKIAHHMVAAAVSAPAAVTASTMTTTNVAITSSTAVKPMPTIITTMSTPSTSMTFGQLEEALGRFQYDVPEQEAAFIAHATHVNAYDRHLRQNTAKVCYSVNAVCE
jgi:hypothetical protein